MLKTIEVRWGLPNLTARDAAAPDLGDVLTLTTPRTDDPIAGVVAPVSTGANPAAGEVSHLEQLHAQMISNLPVPVNNLLDKPLLPNQRTPEDYAHYISARTALWQDQRDAALGRGRWRGRGGRARSGPVSWRGYRPSCAASARRRSA